MYAQTSTHMYVNVSIDIGTVTQKKLCIGIRFFCFTKIEYKKQEKIGHYGE